MMQTIKEVIYDGQAYEVLFDGAHDHDRDLLVAERIPTKRPAPKLPRPPVVDRLSKTMTQETNTRDGAIRSLLHTRQVTVGEIRQVTGASDHQVRTALTRLRRVGMLRWDSIAIRRGEQWRPATRYWLDSEDDAA
jgi:hypothetical protein